MKHARPIRVLVVGAGYVGSRLAILLNRQGDPAWTLRRTPDPGNPHALTGDITRPETIPFPPGLTHLVFSAGLQSADLASYRALFIDGLNRLIDLLPKQAPDLRRVLFCSTTGVYHETKGNWIDESTPANPRRDNARIYHEAECLLHDRLPHAVVARLSGIYGPGRDRLVRLVASGEARLLPGPPRYLNHLRVEDAAGAIAHLLRIDAPESVYLLTDHEPVDRNLVLTHIAERLHLPPPPEADANDVPPLGRGGNKRCRNHRLVQSGYIFRFPTYREGYPIAEEINGSSPQFPEEPQR